MKLYLSIFLLLMLNLANAQNVQELSQDFANHLVEGNYESCTEFFNDKVKGMMNAERLETSMKQLEAQNGKLIKHLKTLTEKKGSFDITYTELRFEKQPLDLQLTFQGNEIAGMYFLPHKDRLGLEQKEIQKKAPYLKVPVKEIDLKIPTPENELDAKLTLPEGHINPPLVILVHGSGPIDMDVTIGETKMFYDLSRGLAINGIATLRYNKRTKEHPEECGEDITLKEETIDDAVMAFEIIKDRDDINTDAIFYLGHSLGAIATPRILKATEARGAIMTAPSSRRLSELVYDQLEYIYKLSDDQIDNEEAASLQALEMQNAKLDSFLAGEIEEQAQLALGLEGTYYKYLEEYDVLAETRELNRPLLIVFGEKDYQVTEKDITLFKENLEGDDNSTIEVLEGLNHAMMEVEEQSSPEDYQEERHVSMEYLNTITSWIVDRSH